MHKCLTSACILSCIIRVQNNLSCRSRLRSSWATNLQSNNKNFMAITSRQAHDIICMDYFAAWKTATIGKGGPAYLFKTCFHLVLGVYPYLNYSHPTKYTKLNKWKHSDSQYNFRHKCDSTKGNVYCLEVALSSLRKMDGEIKNKTLPQFLIKFF